MYPTGWTDRRCAERRIRSKRARICSYILQMCQVRAELGVLRRAGSRAKTRMCCWPLARKSLSIQPRSTEPYVKKAVLAAAATCVLVLACARAYHAGAQGMFDNGMRLCLSRDLIFAQSTNPPPIRLEGAPLSRLFAKYSRFYRGAQAEVDLVLVYQRGDAVLLVPFAEGCATSLARKIDTETWEVLSGTIWRPSGVPPSSWMG